MADIAEVVILVRDQGADAVARKLDALTAAEQRVGAESARLSVTSTAAGAAVKGLAAPAELLTGALGELATATQTSTGAIGELAVAGPEAAATLAKIVESAASMAAGLDATHPAIAETLAQVAALRAEAGLLPASMEAIAAANKVAAVSFEELGLAASTAAKSYFASPAGQLEAGRAETLAALSATAATPVGVTASEGPSAAFTAQVEKADASMQAYRKTLTEVAAAGGDLSTTVPLYQALQSEQAGAVAAAEGLRSLGLSMEAAGGGARNLGKDLAGGGDGFNRLGTAASSAGTSAVLATAKLLGVTLTVAGMVKATHDAISAAIEQENAIAGLNAQLAIQGRFTDTLSGSLITQARALETTTTFSDQLIERVQTMLSTFPRLSNQQLPQATKITLDLATAMGTDAVQAARNLGVALDDPVGGMLRLSRAGIRIPADLRQTIKTLVDTGDIAKADTIILDYLSDRLGGRAAAAAQTFGGQLSQAKNAVVDLLEQVGNIVIKSDAARDGIASLRDYVNSLTAQLGDWIAQNRNLIDQDIGSVIAGISEAGRGLPAFLTTVRDDSVDAARALSGFAQILDLVGRAFSSLPPEVQKLLLTGVGVGLIGGPVAGVTAATFVGASDLAQGISNLAPGLKDTLATLGQTPEVVRTVDAAAAEMAASTQTAEDRLAGLGTETDTLRTKLEGEPDVLARVSDAVDHLALSWSGVVQKVQDYLGLNISTSGAAAGLAAVLQPETVSTHAGNILATNVSASPAVSTDAKNLANQYAELAGNTRLVFDATGAVQGAMSSADVVFTQTTSDIRDVVAEYNAYAAAASKQPPQPGKPDKEIDSFVKQVLKDIHDGESEFAAFQARAVKAFGEGKLSVDQFNRAMGFAIEQFTGAHEATAFLTADYQRLKGEAARIWEESRTPAEKYQEAIKGVNELLDHHLVTADTAQREIQNLTDAYDADAKAMRDSVDPAAKLADAIDKINAAAAAHPTIITPQIQTELIAKATEEANKDTGKGFRDILNATEGFGKQFAKTLADGLATGRIEWQSFLRSLLADINEILIKATVGDFITGLLQGAVIKPLEKATTGGQGFLGLGTTLGQKLIGGYIAPTLGAGTGSQSTTPGAELTGPPQEGTNAVESVGGAGFQAAANIAGSNQFFTSLSTDFNGLINTVESGFTSTFSNLEGELSNLFSELFGGGGGFNVGSFFESLVPGIGGGLAHTGGGGASLAGGTDTQFLANDYAAHAGALFHGGGIAHETLRSVFHAGGVAAFYHAGGLRSDEVPAILQTGEMVLPRTVTTGLIDVMRRRPTVRRFHDGGYADGSGAVDFSNWSSPAAPASRQSTARRSTDAAQFQFTVNFTHNIATLDPRTHAQLLQQQQPVLEKIVVDSIRRGGKLAAAVGQRDGGNR